VLPGHLIEKIRCALSIRHLIDGDIGLHIAAEDQLLPSIRGGAKISEASVSASGSSGLGFGR